MVWLKLWHSSKIIIPLLLALSFAQSTVSSKEADVHFKKIYIEVAGKKIKVELADTPEKQARGLMYRKSLPANEGMLFTFAQEEPQSFWMKNTFIDLSIGYFDKNRKLIDIKEMKAVRSEMEVNLPTYQSLGPAQYALEMPKEWFAKNKIKLGSTLRILD